MSSTNLPDELVEEILTRLPVNSLFRFRCVSKPWKAIIDSSNFTKLHLSKNRKYHYLFYLQEYESTNDELDGESSSDELDEESIFIIETNFKFGQVDLLNWSNRCHDSTHCPDRIIFENFKLPFSSPYDIEVLGSCDGLIALGNFSLMEIILVNPSTREYQSLPPMGKQVGECDAGFGYDCFRDEYKLLVMPSQMDCENGVGVNIWGSKSNTWRHIQFSSNYNTYVTPCYGKFRHGALHWIVGDPRCHFPSRIQTVKIAAFDMTTEKFVVTEYDCKLFGYPFGVRLEVLGGCLCLCCQHDNKGGDMDIWMMKEYGVKESWCKLVSFDRHVTPLALSVCGRSLLIETSGYWNCSCDIRWCNLDNMSKECLGGSTVYTSYSCPQSLVRLPEKLS